MNNHFECKNIIYLTKFSILIINLIIIIPFIKFCTIKLKNSSFYMKNPIFNKNIILIIFYSFKKKL